MLNKINSLEEYKNEYEFSIQNPELFWAKNASKFYWYKKWDRILDWNFSEPNVQWFQGGKLNITENCIDRHLKKNADKVAIKWVPNNIEEQDRSITYRELHQQVSKFSNVLLKNGAKIVWSDIDQSTRVVSANTIKKCITPKTRAIVCLLYTSPSPRDKRQSRMPSSA